MKTKKNYSLSVILLMLTISTVNLNAQLNMTVNSLADDEYAYAWDDPNTPVDESSDGICQDELGRCTIRAAIEESNNMGQSLYLNFSVNGTINLTDVLYPEDGTIIWADDAIEMNGVSCLELNNNSQIEGIKFNNTFSAVSVTGNHNIIGPHNVFLNGYVALDVEGDSNTVGHNFIGIDTANVLGPNQLGILLIGNQNVIEHNTICGNFAGISVSEGEYSTIRANFIGTTSGGGTGFGNTEGLLINDSQLNLIGGEDPADGNVISGNSIVGLEIGGVPPENHSVSNTIWNNIVGLDPSQSSAIPNGHGIEIANGAWSDLIGKNVVAGNYQSGIHIFGYDDSTKSQDHIITENFIGTNSSGDHYPNGADGISIQGNVQNIKIGADLAGLHLPNTIVSNHSSGISVVSDFGFNPAEILFRKNKVYQNDASNISLSSQANNGIQPPYGLSFSNNTIAGIHDIPNVLIDIYKANINEFQPSAYEWLGSTTAGANGVFSYEITDPSVEAVSLTATTINGNTSAFGYLELITGVVRDDNKIPASFSLLQNYPNPFNPSTTIKFSLPKGGMVSLKIFNSLGEEVEELINEMKPAGNYSVSFDAGKLASGIYLYKLSAGNFNQIKKMILVK